MSAAIQQRMALANKVAELRKVHPDAIAHADNTAVIAPREVANRIHHMFTGKVIEPIFVNAPGKRTLVVPRASGGGVEYRTVPMV